MMKGDARVAASVATQDGVIMPPGLSMREGRGALEECFSQGRVASLELEPLVIEGEGRWAYDPGTFRVVLPDSASRDGKYLWVWRREPDVGWQGPRCDVGLAAAALAMMFQPAVARRRNSDHTEAGPPGSRLAPTVCGGSCRLPGATARLVWQESPGFSSS